MNEAWAELRPRLEYLSKRFPDEAIARANEFRAEVTPELVRVIDDLADDPSLADEPKYVLHFFAMHLLAQWREPAAYRPLVKLGHLDDDTLESLLGDTVTETYSSCLASVCDGDPAPLRDLVEDAAASHWARHAALEAMATRVLQGDADREELIEYLARLGDAEAARLTAPGAEPAALEMIDGVVSVATDIGALGLLPRIREWYAARIMDPMIADLAWVEQHIARPYETIRAEQIARSHRYVTDLKREIGWLVERPESRPARPEPIVRPVRSTPKVGRNEPCPCGSGKKYKRCCGA